MNSHFGNPNLARTSLTSMARPALLSSSPASMDCLTIAYSTIVQTDFWIHVTGMPEFSLMPFHPLNPRQRGTVNSHIFGGFHTVGGSQGKHGQT